MRRLRNKIHFLLVNAFRLFNFVYPKQNVYYLFQTLYTEYIIPKQTCQHLK